MSLLRAAKKSHLFTTSFSAVSMFTSTVLLACRHTHIHNNNVELLWRLKKLSVSEHRSVRVEKEKGVAGGVRVGLLKRRSRQQEWTLSILLYLLTCQPRRVQLAFFAFPLVPLTSLEFQLYQAGATTGTGGKVTFCLPFWRKIREALLVLPINHF